MSTRKLRLRAVQGESFGQALPVEVFKHDFEVEPGRKVFVFVIRGEDRKALSSDGLKNLGQVLGDLAYPAQCVMPVVPEGLALEIYEVEEEPDAEAEDSN